MTHSGYIDWHRIGKTGIDTQEGSTFVYAYWPVDYQRSERDHGVTLLKAEGGHPDWFLNGDHAEEILFSMPGDHVHPSPNVTDIYDEHLTSRPLLAAICLGTANATYQHPGGGYWWCSPPDLTRPGKRLIKELSMLYLRPAIIISFLHMRPMKKAVPGAGRDQATVSRAPGHFSEPTEAMRPTG